MIPDFGISAIDLFNVAVTNNLSPLCVWVTDLTSVPDASDGVIDVFAPVLDNVITNFPSGYDREYVGFPDVSMTRRVLLPGCKPVRNARNLFGAANATRGKNPIMTEPTMAVCKKTLRDIFIEDILSEN